jgi:hypothetical protein
VEQCFPVEGGLSRLTIRRAFLEDPRIRLLHAEVALDGKLIFASSDTNRLLTKVEVVHASGIASGPHQISTRQLLKGHGVGVESYLNGYSFEVKSSHSVSVAQAGATCLTIVLYLRGDESTPLEKRLAIRYVTNGSADSASEDWGGPSPVPIEPQRTSQR